MATLNDTPTWKCDQLSEGLFLHRATWRTTSADADPVTNSFNLATYIPEFKRYYWQLNFVWNTIYTKNDMTAELRLPASLSYQPIQNGQTQQRYQLPQENVDNDSITPLKEATLSPPIEMGLFLANIPSGIYTTISIVNYPGAASIIIDSAICLLASLKSFLPFKPSQLSYPT